MTNKRINWILLERIGLYSSLIVFILFQSLSLLWPQLADSIPQGAAGLFLGTSLIISVHMILRGLESREAPETFLKHSTFTAALMDVLSGFNVITELQIAAFTSGSHFEHLRLQRQRIEKLRLLLLFTDGNGDSADSISRHQEQIVNGWKRLAEDSFIRHIEIRRVDNDGLFYFTIANNKKVLLGLLWPRRNSKDLHPQEAITFSRDSRQGGLLLAQLKPWFESMWENAAKLHETTERSG